MQSYTHFTLTERESLRILQTQGISLREIARRMGRNVSSISRELRRNCNKRTGLYSPWGATCLYLKRRKHCHRKLRLQYDAPLRIFACDALRQYWPPEAIVARWKRAHPGDKLAHTTLYHAIHCGLLPDITAKTHLRRRGGKKYRNGASNTIKPDRTIHERSDEANDRRSIGHWEGDTVQGGKNKGCVVTMVDRKSRYLAAALAQNKSAAVVKCSMIQALGGATAHTITLDNGSEFAAFREVEAALGTEIYFADPHAPWQRGTNENLNGLLRFFFPKGCDFHGVLADQLQHVVQLINDRPRKSLDWLSPKDVFFAMCCS